MTELTNMTLINNNSRQVLYFVFLGRGSTSSFQMIQQLQTQRKMVQKNVVLKQQLQVNDV